MFLIIGSCFFLLESVFISLPYFFSSNNEKAMVYFFLCCLATLANNLIPVLSYISYKLVKFVQNFLCHNTCLREGLFGEVLC